MLTEKPFTKELLKDGLQNMFFEYLNDRRKMCKIASEAKLWVSKLLSRTFFRCSGGSEELHITFTGGSRV